MAFQRLPLFHRCRNSIRNGSLHYGKHSSKRDRLRRIARIGDHCACGLPSGVKYVDLDPGVAIGFAPKLARFSQPIVQVFASFPANFLFPLATMAFLKFHISLNWGSILLMALGAQWYILFNIIGGAQSIPNDLREMSRNLGLRGVRAWKKLIGPGVFASWVTGAITASGGAWNASIVSELVSWGNIKLSARGLGAYIADATEKGDWPRIVLGVGIMSLFVVAFNRLIWRPLYRLAENKYRIA